MPGGCALARRFRWKLVRQCGIILTSQIHVHQFEIIRREISGGEGFETIPWHPIFFFFFFFFFRIQIGAIAGSPVRENERLRRRRRFGVIIDREAGAAIRLLLAAMQRTLPAPHHGVLQIWQLIRVIVGVVQRTLNKRRIDLTAESCMDLRITSSL